MNFSAYEDIVQITPLWEGERFSDGRPKVSDDILRRIRNITLEEAWGALHSRGYKFQFQGNFRESSPGKKLVGRAVTAVMVPKRPDLHDALMNHGLEKEGRRGFFNQWVIDSLVEDDVCVIDLYDKILYGTYVGGNLSTAIASRTKRGGAVIWGGVRDLEQIVEVPGLQIFFRGNDPTAIADCVMTGMNAPCRIGEAICLPGDVVLGTLSGVLFIPPHLADICASGAEKSHIRDVFGFKRLSDKTYSTAEVDSPWTIPMWQDFISWIASVPEAEGYRHLTWEKELSDAKTRAEGGDPQVRQ